MTEQEKLDANLWMKAYSEGERNARAEADAKWRKIFDEQRLHYDIRAGMKDETITKLEAQLAEAVRALKEIAEIVPRSVFSRRCPIIAEEALAKLRDCATPEKHDL